MSGINELTQVRLAEIRDNEALYEPNDTIRHALAHKSLALIIGPCAGGKSYAIRELLELDARFRQSRSFTTRDPRSDDTPATIRYIGWNDREIREFCDEAENGELVNYTFHPKTGEIYGTTLDDHPGVYNLMPTMASATAPLHKLPFQTIETIGIVAAPDVWQRRFDARTDNNQERQARLAEAASCLAWLLDHTEVAIVSSSDDEFSAAKQIYGVMEHSRAWRDERTTQALLDRIALQI